MISSLIYRQVRPLIEENEAEGGRPGKCGSRNSYDVGLNRIPLTSVSSGWLMAKSTQRAKLSAGIAYFLSLVSVFGAPLGLSGLHPGRLPLEGRSNYRF